MIQFFIDHIKQSIFLKIFMGLMVISFGIWGIGDVITPNLDPTIAIKADNVEVRAEELQRRFSREVERMRDAMNNTTPDATLKAAILSNTIADLKRNVSSNIAADEFGVFVTTDMIRERIEADENFHDETGKFNQMNFMQILSQNSLTEQGFVTLFQNDLRENLLLQPVAAGATPPQALVDQIFAYRAETRIADTLLISSEWLDLPRAPTEEDYKKTYDDNISSFTAPEYRKIEAVVLLEADLVPPDSVDEAAVRAFYDENAARYRTKEKRRVSQLVFETQAEATDARSKMATGDGLMAIATKANIPAPIDLGERDIDDGVLVGFGEAIKLPVGQISEPVESALGWHLIEVLSIVPEQVTPYEQNRDQIRSTLAKEKALDAIADASIKLEDEIVAGTSMADAAASTGGRALNLEAVDRTGLDPTGVTVETIVEREKFLDAAFRAAVNVETPLMEVEGGYFVLRVTSITPPTPKQIDLVRPEVLTMWQRQTRLAEAQAIAEKKAAELKPGALSAEADADKRFSYGQLGPITRFGESLERAYIIDSKRVSPDLLERLFKAKVGDVVTAPVLNGHVIARLREILPAKAEGELASAPAQMAANLKSSVSQDLVLQFMRAVEDRFPVTVNKEVVDQLAAAQNN